MTERGYLIPGSRRKYSSMVREWTAVTALMFGVVVVFGGHGLAPLGVIAFFHGRMDPIMLALCVMARVVWACFACVMVLPLNPWKLTRIAIGAMRFAIVAAVCLSEGRWRLGTVITALPALGSAMRLLWMTETRSVFRA